jgi:hypothetical protein
VNTSRGTWIGIGVLALVALAVTALPSGGNAVDVVFDALRAAFLVMIGFAGWRLYVSQQFWLSSLSDLHRGVLYGAIAAAVFVMAAGQRFAEVGAGQVGQLIVLAGCAGAVYWVWSESRRYVV